MTEGKYICCGCDRMFSEWEAEIGWEVLDIIDGSIYAEPVLKCPFCHLSNPELSEGE